MLSSIAYIPHGHCFLWQRSLVALHVTSDVLIALAYFSIPAILVYFVGKRQNTPFKSVFVLFSLFIASCGVGHLLDIWTLWFPTYWIAGAERAVTAFVSCLTAVKLVEWLPQFLALRSPQELESLNQQLQQEVTAHKGTQQTLKHLIEGTASTTGEAFFPALVQKLSQALHVRHAFIYEWVPSTATMRSLAVWTDGGLNENSEETVGNHPCLLQLQQGNPCHCPDQVQKQFEHRLMATLGAQACLGVPLLDTNGHSLGALCIAHDPLPHQLHEVEAIMAMFAARASAELQRQRAESALRQAYHELETRVVERTLELRRANIQLTKIAQQEQAAARALAEAKQAADQASQAKSEFLATMSHELRTPLNAILGFTQLMHHHADLSQRHQQYVDIINNSGEHLLGLINNILEMSKIEAGQVKLTQSTGDLHRLLREVQELLTLKAEQKGVALHVTPAPDVPHLIYTDVQKLRQILLNLLGNSIKFTHQGHVELRVTLASPGKQGSNSAPRAQNWPLSKAIALSFTVEDTGVGISEADLSKLFAAFQQTQSGHELGQGTGLGLPISQQYVRLLGGELQVNSRVGEGSVFFFTIPVCLLNSSDQTTYGGTPQRIAGLAPQQQPPRVLLVEDNAVNRLLLKKLLTPLEMDIREAHNGEEAIELWQSWEPDLIWMDMLMPGMDGYEATRRIRAAEASSGHSHTCIIALTANAFEESKQDMLAAGCDDALYKPFKVESILQMMQKHLRLEFVYEVDT